jgi:hypothetical protein
MFYFHFFYEGHCWLSSLNVEVIVISNIVRSLKPIKYVTTESEGKRSCHVKVCT